MSTEETDTRKSEGVTIEAKRSPPSSFTVREQARVLVEIHTGEIWSFARRLELVLGVRDELRRVCRDQAFLVNGVETWSLLLGERDMIIVDLASWAVGLHSSKGLIRGVYDGGTDALAKSAPGADPEWRGKAFAHLFPNSSSKRLPTRDDLDELLKRLKADFKALDDHRNNFCAHRYEREAVRAEVKELDLDGVLVHHERCAELVTAFRTLCLNDTHVGLKAQPSVIGPGVHDTVDLILLGTIEWIHAFGPSRPNGDSASEQRAYAEEGRLYGERREKFYANLWASYDARGDKRRPFNDPAAALDDLAQRSQV